MFNRFHLGIMLSMWLVLAALLGLQLVLNGFKFQSLVTTAIAERMQVTASTIESSIVKAEQLGLSINQMNDLQALLERELSKSDIIENIVIVAPDASVIFDSNYEKEEFLAVKDNLLNRILTKDKATFATEVGGKLYASRKLFDSTSNVMAILILTTDSKTYASAIANVKDKMMKDFLWLFGILSVLLIPIVIFGFSKISKLIKVIEYDLFHRHDELSKQTPPADLEHPDHRELREKLLHGKEAFDSAEHELDELLGKAYAEKEKR